MRECEVQNVSVRRWGSSCGSGGQTEEMETDPWSTQKGHLSLFSLLFHRKNILFSPRFPTEVGSMLSMAQVSVWSEPHRGGNGTFCSAKQWGASNSKQGNVHRSAQSVFLGLPLARKHCQAGGPGQGAQNMGSSQPQSWSALRAEQCH